MTFLAVLVVVVACAAALRNPIRRWPGAFYALAVLADVLLIASSGIALPTAVRIPFLYLMQRGGLGVALFVLVMYIGVFPRAGRVSLWFRPIRAELSIIACILICGHMCAYLPSYLPSLLSGSFAKSNVGFAIVVALCLLALVLVLGITSFRFVKRHMRAHTWKKLQSLAYLFYVLMFVHLGLMLVPGALAGNARTAFTVIVYMALVVVYVIARVWRAVVDRREKVDLAETVRSQGFAE